MTTKKTAPRKAAPAAKPAVKSSPARKGLPQGVKATGKALEQPAVATKVRTDWEAVERDYRIGKLTLREMAEKHGTTAGRICQVSKEKGWTRGDLKTVVNAATQSLLVAASVEGEVNKVKQGLNDAVIVAAEMNKQVILQHRADLAAMRELAMDMRGELSATTKSADRIEALFEQLTAELDGPAKMAVTQQFRDFMRLHSRVGSVHKLADTLKKVQELERKAFNLDDDSSGGSTGYEDALEDIYSEIQGK